MKKARCLICLAVLLMQFSPLWAKIVEIECPEFCKCDIFRNFKRASCQHRRLVSMEINLSSQAEILDLSDNHISELGDRIFVQINLTDLKMLNLSHNKIRQIHFNGFEGLDNLKSLDLSFNALEYFTQSWFHSLKSLEEFYLRGNKLRKINEEPPIEIHSLKVLDISSCGITKLSKDTFKYLPNLEVLDISDNFIQIINADILKSLPKLTTLKAEDNNFNCKDDDVIEFENYAKSKKIASADFCTEEVETFFSINNIIHKFEKMRMTEDSETTTSTSIAPRNSWIFDDSKPQDNITICINSTSNVTKSFSKNSFLLEIMLLSPWATLFVVFAYGVLCGVLLIWIISLCSKNPNRIREDSEIPDGSIHRNTQPKLPLKQQLKNLGRSDRVYYKSLENGKRRSSREILDDDSDDGDTLVMNAFELAHSTPASERRGPL